MLHRTAEADRRATSSLCALSGTDPGGGVLYYETTMKTFSAIVVAIVISVLFTAFCLGTISPVPEATGDVVCYGADDKIVRQIEVSTFEMISGNRAALVMNSQTKEYEIVRPHVGVVCTFIPRK